MTSIEIDNRLYIDNPLSEAEYTNLVNDIRSLMESEDFSSSFKEIFKEDYEKMLSEESFKDYLAHPGQAVLFVFAKLINIIKGNYSLKAKRLANQSKRINDMYAKIEDLLKNDKFTRYRHKDDKIDTSVRNIVLIDKKNATKKYKYTGYVGVGYDPDYLKKQCDEIIQVARQKKTPAEKKEVLTSSTKSVIDNFNKNFDSYYGFIKITDPFMMVTDYKSQKLETCLLVYKSYFESYYNGIYNINELMANQLVYIQMNEQAYKNMTAEFKGDKECQQCIEAIFKNCINNMMMCMDFDEKSLTIYESILDHAYDELVRIYDIIKS